MDIERYLAEGGRVTSPQGLPPRYRAELLRLMATFVDSSLAGAAGFADIINAAPGIEARIAAAKIVLEKTDHAGRVLRVMADFGADTARYATHHPWTGRLPRSAPPEARLDTPDQRLSVFAFPLDGWTDAVVMNLVMGTAAGVQMDDLVQVSYQPLAEAVREIAPREARHTGLAAEGLAQALARGDRDRVAASLAYWTPRVAQGFGSGRPERLAQLTRFGLRHTAPETQAARWRAALAQALAPHGLTLPG